MTMTEEIYIDGERLDIEAGGGGIQLVYQSPYFTDLSAIVSNRTNQVTLPMTARNRRVIGYTGTQADALFAYRKHAVAYKRDGVQIFSGQATLLTIAPDKFTMCFVWGNANNFQDLFDTRLSALGEFDTFHEEYINYPATNSAYYSDIVQFGVGRRQPMMSVGNILYRMWQRFGLSALYRDEWLNYYIAELTKKGDTETRRMQGVVMNHNGTRVDYFQSPDFAGYNTYAVKGTNSTDPHEYMNAQGIIPIGEAKHIRLRLTGSLQFTKRANTPYEPQLIFAGLKEDGFWYKIETLAEGTITFLGSVYRYSYTGLDIDKTYATAGYTSFALLLAQDALDYVATMETYATEFYFVPDPDKDDDVIYDTHLVAYPRYLNLPDISCGQFIKNLMRISDLFAYTDNDGTMKFTSLANLYGNRIKAVDWTDRVLLTGGKPTEYKGTMDGVAQKNWLRWTEDDSIPKGKYDAYMPSDNETAEAETDVFTGDFNLAPDNYIPVWTQEEEGAEIEFQGDSLTPRILRGESTISAQTAQNDDNLAWSKILTARYAEYKQIILHPVTIKVSVLVSTAELHALDLTIPVYLRQTGRYYCIKQLTTKNGNVADVELIQL